MHEPADLRGAFALQPLADVEDGGRRPQLLLQRRGVQRENSKRARPIRQRGGRRAGLSELGLEGFRV